MNERMNMESTRDVTVESDIYILFNTQLDQVSMKVIKLQANHVSSLLKSSGCSGEGR